MSALPGSLMLIYSLTAGSDMKAFLYQFRNQALGFIREPSAAIFNLLVPFIIVVTQALAFGDDLIGSPLPGYRIVDALPINAGVMFTMIIGLFGMGIGLSSMIESRTLAGASVRPLGAGLILQAYALVLLVMVLLGWAVSFLTLRLWWRVHWPSHPLAVIPIMTLNVAMFLMIGACIASVTGTPRSAQGICSAAFFPLLFLSGAVFPIDVFPHAFQVVARWLPGYRVSELLSSVWIEGQAFDWISMVYVVVVLLLASVAARWLLGRREDI